MIDAAQSPLDARRFQSVPESVPASSAPTNPREASKLAENRRAGLQISSSKSCKWNDR